MISLLLAVIYLAFISLGLPDAILGSAWPNMYRSLNSTITGAGSIFLIISVCTIISSLNADRVIHKFSTARVTAVSVGLTALSLFGFSFCQEYILKNYKLHFIKHSNSICVTTSFKLSI